MKNNYKISFHTKTTIELWNALQLNNAFGRKKVYLDIYMKKKT